MIKIVLSFLLFSTGLLADRDGGPYLGIGYGLSQYDDRGLYDEVKDDISKSSTYYAGAYINKHLSVELSKTSFSARGTDDGYLVSESSTSQKYINFSSISVSTLAHYAFFDDMLDFYARYGVGQIDHSGVGGSGFNFVYGVGMGIRLNEYSGVKLAYDMYAFDYDDARDSSNIVGYRMRINYIYSALEVQF